MAGSALPSRAPPRLRRQVRHFCPRGRRVGPVGGALRGAAPSTALPVASPGGPMRLAALRTGGAGGSGAPRAQPLPRGDAWGSGARPRRAAAQGRAAGAGGGVGGGRRTEGARGEGRRGPPAGGLWAALSLAATALLGRPGRLTGSPGSASEPGTALLCKSEQRRAACGAVAQGIS